MQLLSGVGLYNGRFALSATLPGMLCSLVPKRAAEAFFLTELRVLEPTGEGVVGSAFFTGDLKMLLVSCAIFSASSFPRFTASNISSSSSSSDVSSIFIMKEGEAVFLLLELSSSSESPESWSLSIAGFLPPFSLSCSESPSLAVFSPSSRSAALSMSLNAASVTVAPSSPLAFDERLRRLEDLSDLRSEYTGRKEFRLVFRSTSDIGGVDT
mmetsp:Transcript_3435/g.5855  ORF Transcript_3435/g.5855 Transcript_3435/m.5855 type:complete len:212 (-) Transcript_3435:986-1621(-)